jgi:hypothetical protein
VPFALTITVMALVVVARVGSAATEPDRFGMAIEFVRSTFPQLRAPNALRLSAIVDGAYEPIRLLAVDVFVEPSATMQRAKAARSASELHQLLLHAIVHLDDERRLRAPISMERRQEDKKCAVRA